jgi:hypothetical protein
MKRSILKYVFGILVVGVLTLLSVSPDVMAQGRGRGRSHSDNKCGKFVNCHDARDGRWDGRGPNRNVRYTGRSYRRSRRNRDFNNFDRRSRRHRDFDRDRNWRHRR